VILDYAHNSAGLEALGEVVTGLRHRYKRSLGVLSIPGDRRDEDIIGLGRIAGTIFDELFFREDPGTRGRPRGEVMRLLQQGAIESGAAEDRVHLIPTEEGATAAALMAARPGDLLIVTPTTGERDLAADHFL
jgi:cyanophycin synthetase